MQLLLDRERLVLKIIVDDREKFLETSYRKKERHSTHSKF